MHYTKMPREQSILLTTFGKMNSSKITRDIQQNHKKFGQKHNYISGPFFSLTEPRSSLLIVVVEDFFTQVKGIFLINHLSCTLIFSIMNLELTIEQFQKIAIRRS